MYRTRFACGHIRIYQEQFCTQNQAEKKSGFWGKIKNLTRKAQKPQIEDWPFPCESCLNEIHPSPPTLDENGFEEIPLSPRRKILRKAPPARGTTATIYVVATGSEQAAIEALRREQEQALQQQTTSEPVPEISINQQIQTAASAQRDLDGSVDFWRKLHTHHVLTCERPLPGGPERCPECRKMQIQLTNPSLRHGIRVAPRQISPPAPEENILEEHTTGIQELEDIESLRIRSPDWFELLNQQPDPNETNLETIERAKCKHPNATPPSETGSWPPTPREEDPQESIPFPPQNLIDRLRSRVQPQPQQLTQPVPAQSSKNTLSTVIERER